MSADKLPKTTVSDGFLKENSETADAVAVGSVLPLEQAESAKVAAEVGGRGGLDPTRFGDWEKNGRCIDF